MTEPVKVLKLHLQLPAEDMLLFLRHPCLVPGKPGIVFQAPLRTAEPQDMSSLDNS